MFICLFIIVSIGFASTLKDAHQYELIVPEKFHDTKKILTLLNIKSHDATSIDELKVAIDSAVDLMGIKVANLTPKLHCEPDNFEAYILSTIDSMKLNHKSDTQVKTNIQYFEAHKKVSAINISYMLGILLENALETKTSYPIEIDILATEHVLFIKISNEAEAITQTDIKNIYSKGFSTKGKVGRGFGLPKLKKLVESFDGTISITADINAREQVKYLTFTLNF